MMPFVLASDNPGQRRKGGMQASHVLIGG